MAGTVTPMSGIGKLIGGICALMGVFTITLPVPIMVNNFHQFYKNKLWRGEVALQRRERQRLGVPDANPKKYSCVLATTGEKGSTKERQHLNQVELNGVQSWSVLQNLRTMLNGCGTYKVISMLETRANIKLFNERT